MEELRVEVLLVMEHTPDGVEHPAHNGNGSHLGFLAAGEQGVIGSLDLRAVADSYQRRHEQSQTQVAVAGAADMARGIFLPALAGRGSSPA